MELTERNWKSKLNVYTLSIYSKQTMGQRKIQKKKLENILR
jgi:hypothetical protein